MRSVMGHFRGIELLHRLNKSNKPLCGMPVNKDWNITWVERKDAKVCLICDNLESGQMKLVAKTK